MREAANYVLAHIVWPSLAHNLGHNLLHIIWSWTTCLRKFGGAERLYTGGVQVSPLHSKHELCARVHVYKYRAVVQTLECASYESTAPLLVFVSGMNQLAASVGLTASFIGGFPVVAVSRST